MINSDNVYLMIIGFGVIFIIFCYINFFLDVHNSEGPNAFCIRVSALHVNPVDSTQQRDQPHQPNGNF